MIHAIEKTAKTVDDAIQEALEDLQLTREQVDVEVLAEDKGGFLGLGKSATVRVSPKVSEETVEDPYIPDMEETEFANVDSEVLEERLDTDEARSFETSAREESSLGEVEVAEQNYADEATVTSPAVEEVSVGEISRPSHDTEENHDSEVLHTQEVAEEADEASEESDEEELSEEEKLAIASDAVEEFLAKILKSFAIDDVNELSMETEDNRLIAKIQGDDCGILIGRKGITLRAIQYIASLLANRTTKSRVRFTLDIGAYKEKRQDSVSDLAKRTAERAISTGQAYELTPMSAAERRIVHECLQDFEGITTYSEGDEPNRYVVIDLAYEDEEVVEENDI